MIAGAPAAPRRPRLEGVDLARAVAIIGMFLMHTYAHSHPQWEWLSVFRGRSTILFALLAGFSVILLTRRGGTGYGPSLILRGLILTALGLALSAPDVGGIVILTTYGALYLLIAPWAYRLSTGVLTYLAIATALAAPITSVLLEPLLLPREDTFGVPEWPLLAEGAFRVMIEQVLVSGSFPALLWLPVFFSAMVLGRVVLGTDHLARTAGRIALLGAGLWVTGLVISAVVLDVLGFRVRYAQYHPDGWDAVEILLRNGEGPPRTDFLEWLFVYVPHSGSIAEVISSIGSACTVLGVCLLLPAGVQRVLLPLRAMGQMPLTVYTGHIIAIGVLNAQGLSLAWPGYRILNILVPIVFALIWLRLLPFRRGPLEALVSRATATLRG